MLTRYLSDMMVKPRQSPVFDNPENYDLKYEDMAFKTAMKSLLAEKQIVKEKTTRSTRLVRSND